MGRLVPTMSVCSFLRRNLIPALCVLSLGAAGYFGWAKPFEPRRTAEELIRMADSEEKIAEVAKNALAVQICEEKVSDPRWFLHQPDPWCTNVAQVLRAARSDASVPMLVHVVERYNRAPKRTLTGQYSSTAALTHLVELGTPAAEQALAKLARDFPPFPKPHHATLSLYAAHGWEKETLALARTVIAAYQPLPKIKRGKPPACYIADVATGVAEIDSAEATSLLWEFLEIGVPHSLHGECTPGMPLDRFALSCLAVRVDPAEHPALLLRHLPRVEALQGPELRYREAMIDYAAPPFVAAVSFPRLLMETSGHLPLAMAGFTAAPGPVTAAFERLLAEAGGDLQKIHWLRKLALLEALRQHGTPADLPLLARLREDRSSFRELERGSGEDLKHRLENADEPPAPDWQVVRTRTFGELAAEAEAAVRASVKNESAAKTAGR